MEMPLEMMHAMFISMPGMGEWLVIALVILIFFGAKKIPELARGIGQGLSEFRKATSEIQKEIDKGEKSVRDSVSDSSRKESNNI